MSLYNFLFGENKNSDILLGVIGLCKKDFGRYRDIYLNPEGDTITVLTRLGGLNRKDYEEEINKIKKNELYIKDYDDEYDNTYAYFEFKVPEKYSKMCKTITPKENRLSLKEMFDNEIEQSNIEGSDANKRKNEFTKIILDEIDKAENDINIIGI